MDNTFNNIEDSLRELNINEKKRLLTLLKQSLGFSNHIDDELINEIKESNF